MEKEKYQTYQDFQDNNKKGTKSSKKFLLIVIAVLAAIIIALSYLYFSHQQEAKQIQQELELQKETLTEDLIDISVRYDSLRTDNDSMNLKLQEEQLKIKRLLSLRASNLQKIRIYKKELGTLRDVMKSYITQIDSLNTLNKQLTAENIMVKSEYKQVKSDNRKLSEKNESLSSTVKLAKIMKADLIEVAAINERSRSVTKAKKVDKIQVCFTLLENRVVKAGTKDVFIRILTQDNYVLVNSEDNLFTVDETQIVYSETRQIQYENVDIDMCIFWKNNGKLATGNYDVFIYTEGHEIGRSVLSLK